MPGYDKGNAVQGYRPADDGHARDDRDGALRGPGWPAFLDGSEMVRAASTARIPDYQPAADRSTSSSRTVLVPLLRQSGPPQRLGQCATAALFAMRLGRAA